MAGQTSSKYIVHTADTIDSNFEFNDNVLFTAHCDAESVTSGVIKETIKENLAGNYQKCYF